MSPDGGDAPGRPAWERPALAGLLVATGVLYLWGLGASGWANAFYSAAVQAGVPELEGLLLRLVRRLERHHRRQAAGVAVGHGPVSARLRRQRPGASWCPQALEGVATVGAAVRDRPAPVRAARPGLLAGAVAGAHAGRRPDVPVRQPGRAARAAARRRRLRADPGARDGLDALAACWSACSSGSPSWRRCCRRSSSSRASRWSTCWRRRRPLRRRIVQLLVAGAAMIVVGRLVGRDRRAVARVVPAVHRRLADELRARADVRLQRPRPAQRQRDRQRGRRRAAGPGGPVGSDRAVPAVRDRDGRPGRRGCSRPRCC